MLDLLTPMRSPFDAPRTPWHARSKPRARAPPPPPVEPEELTVRVATAPAAYTLTFEAPDAVDVRGASAMKRGRGVVFSATVRSSLPSIYEYALRNRTPLFSAPSRGACVGYLRPGTRVRGGPPDARGWVELDEGEGYVFDDGSIALIGHQESRAAPPRRVEKVADLPADALLEHATVEEGGGAELLVVTVPRKVRRARAPARTQARTPAHMPPREPSPPVDAPATSHRAANAPAASSPATAPVQARSSPPPPAKSAAPAGWECKKARQCEPGWRAGPPTSATPLLVECARNVHNVQPPAESTQHWRAAAGGGFVRAA